MKQILSRALRAARFDRRVFESVRSDPAGPADAALLVAVVAGVVAVAIWLRRSFEVPVTDAITGLLRTVVGWIAAWILLAVFTWLVGTKLFQGHGEWRDLIAAQGIGFLPNALVLVAVLTGQLLDWAALIGYLWYLLVAAVATGVILRLPRRESYLAVLAGLAGLLIMDLAFGRTLQVLHTIGSVG